MDIGRGIFEIAMAIIGIALIALLVNKSSNASELVESAGSTFDSLLRTVTLQNGIGSYGR